MLRSAIIAGIKDLRAHPYLINDIFSECSTDPILRGEFGYAEIDRATKWFLKTNIPVVLQHRLDTVEMPCISVALLSSGERIQEDVLGDYSESEDLDDTQTFQPQDATIQPVVVLGPFTPTAYDPATGLVTLPTGFLTDFVVPGQLLVDRPHNTAYPILSVNSGSTFTIATNTVADFTDAIIMPRYQTLGITRNRIMATESYQIGCHVAGDAVELLWLYSIVTLILLRYKEDLLDARGLTRTTFSASDFVKSPQYEAQNVYSRFFTLNAVVEQNWVASVTGRVEGIKVGPLKVIDGGTTPAGYYEDEIQGQSWRMEDDPDEP